MKSFLILFLFSFVLLFPNKIESAELIEDFKEYCIYSYNVTKYFIIFPFLNRLFDNYQVIFMLPDWSVLQHYDAFGNLLSCPNEILKEDLTCKNVLNFTETFKNFVDHLSAVEKFTVIEFEKLDQTHSKFTDSEMEESSEYWENQYYFYNYAAGNNDALKDEPVSISRLPKTFNTFPLIDVPLRRRFAVVLETYLIDLVRTIYPFIEGARIKKFEDVLGLLLFYLYYHIDDAENNKNISALFKIYLVQVLKNLKSMGTILKLPSPSNLTKSKCFKLLFSDVLKFNLEFTFNLFQSNPLVLGLTQSNLMKRILKCKYKSLIQCHLKNCDRNCDIYGIGNDYSGKLAHLIYWTYSDWLFMELLKYDDVDWDAPDCRGCTVLGYLVNYNLPDRRYRQFLRKTKMFVMCLVGIYRKNIVDECLSVTDPILGLSKFVIYLKERHKSDDFSQLLVSAATHDNLEYFERLLEYRQYNCCHELDASFQLIIQLMRFELVYLYKYLIRIMVNLKNVSDRMGNVFFTKWEIQLAKWRAAADEVGITF